MILDPRRWISPRGVGHRADTDHLVPRTPWRTLCGAQISPAWNAWRRGYSPVDLTCSRCDRIAKEAQP